MTRRAKGEGTLYKDSAGRWVGMADAGINPKTGKRRRVKVTARKLKGKGKYESQKSVAARLAARIAEIEGQGPDAPGTVGELVGLWRDLAAPKRNSPSTLESVDALISKHIRPVLGGVKVGALTPDHVESFLRDRGHLSRSTQSKLRRVLAQAYDFGVRRRYVDWNPARVAEIPADLAAPKPGRSLTVKQAERLVNVAESDRNGALVVVALRMGLRVQEASALSWDRVDLDRGILEVVEALTWTKSGPALKPPKTETSMRRLDMPPAVIEALGRHRARQAEERLLMGAKWPAEWEQLVFVSSVGTPLHPSNLRRWLAELADEAGIDGRVVPRDLRTTAGSLLSHDGVALERIADLLGHRDIRTLQAHYRRPVAPSVDTAAAYWQKQART